MKKAPAPMAIMPEARPSSPSIKLTAFMMPTMKKTETKSHRREDPNVMPKIGKDASWTPPKAMPPAMRTLPPSLAIHSSSMMSSMMPRTHIAPAPAMTAHGIVVVNSGAM